MPFGIVLALAAYGAYACCDALIKGFGQSLTPFEIAFWITLFSILPVIVTRPKDEALRDIVRTLHPLMLNFRALIGTMAGLLIVFAFTTIPLAETYALVFLTPVFITILSGAVLKEEISAQRWIGLLLCFAGVLLVVRPGFKELELGHLAASICALLASGAAIILRVISQSEKRITIVGYSVAYGLILNGAAIAILGRPFVPPLDALAILALIGLIGGSGHVLMIKAAKIAPANLVAPTQYSQIIWAIVLGALFYQEYPDNLALVGMAVVILGGLSNFTPERARTWFGAHTVARRMRRQRRGQPDAVARQPSPENQS